MNQPEEAALFEKVKKSDVKAFEILFHRYYASLSVFATNIIKDDAAAEEIVQEFFVKIWEKRTFLSIETSVKNYLFRSVKNLCINFIEHNKTKLRHIKSVTSEFRIDISAEDCFIEVDLAQNIAESIQSLPEKRREIFRLSREDGLKYREIAEKLNISIKTVEAQMSLAIKTLRTKLKKYNTFFTLLFFPFKISD